MPTTVGSITPPLMELLLASAPEQLKPVIRACLVKAPKTARVRAVESALESATGTGVRDDIGKWVAQLLSTDLLVPDVYSRWRPLVRDAIQFLFSRLSARRLATKLVEQVDLPLDTPPASRLIRLISKMPGIQKLGQVLARHRQLGDPLRKALSELENGMSDVSAARILSIVRLQLGPRLRKYGVKIEPVIFREASVSAIVRFTWRNPDSGERERGVFKVLKPYVPRSFAEDLALLQQLSEFLVGERGYGFASHDVPDMVSEVRLLLEHELDFEGEQATLRDALRTYRLTLGVRIPRIIAPLSTKRITAMSEENGVKVTEAFPGQTYQRQHVAAQLIEALIAVPLLAREKETVLHADPHAGNLLYDERKQELVILDWALTERLDRESRRQLAMLATMTILRNAGGVADAIERLTSSGFGSDPAQARLIRSTVDTFFNELTYRSEPGGMDAVQLLDQVALAGVRFPASLAMFRKALFTLQGVLYDIAGPKVSIGSVLIRDFVLRGLASLGLNHPPFLISDFIALQRSALLYPARMGARALRDAFSSEPSTSNPEASK
jgi:ubiquinone biosynthesis protein